MAGNNPPLMPVPIWAPGSLTYDRMSKAELYDALYQYCLKETGSENHEEALGLLIREVKLAKNNRKRWG